jgi:ElaB/YqjD/DUF883 family membrane-anchored ribosome-binding protein
MMKSGIDQDALVKLFSQATAKQGESIQAAVSSAMLKALQARELTLDNIRKVLKTVTAAASSGVAQNPLGALEIEPLLGQALLGMDAALLQAVEAQHKALRQFVGQGVDLKDKPMKSAMNNLEKMEEVFFTTVSKTIQEGADSLQQPWQKVLASMKQKGTDTGAQADVAVDQLLTQAQAALHEGRTTGLRAAQSLLDSYAALVSGVLIGISTGMTPRAASNAARPGKK